MWNKSILFFVFFLLPFSSFANDAYEKDRKAATKSLDAAKSFIEQNRVIPAKDDFLFTFGACENNDSNCYQAQAHVLVDKKYAYEGVYSAQRNLAFCLSHGCDNAVVINKTLGCAWRIVILASGSPLVGPSDVDNLRFCLEGSDAIERATMRRQAVNLFRVIYDEDLPADWR
jgi:hypothetical protein